MTSSELIMIAMVMIIVAVVAGSLASSTTKQVPAKSASKILRTHLVSVDGIKQSTRSGAVSGALVGGILAGGLGAVVGAMSNTKEHEHTVGHEYTFLVLYDDGTRKLETVRDLDKARLEQLVAKLDVNGEEPKPVKEEKQVCPYCGKMCKPGTELCKRCKYYQSYKMAALPDDTQKQ